MWVFQVGMSTVTESGVAVICPSAIFPELVEHVVRISRLRGPVQTLTAGDFERSLGWMEFSQDCDISSVISTHERVASLTRNRLYVL